MKHAAPPAKSPASLLRHRHTIPQTLPPLEDVLRGSLLQREIRCGKPTCRCATGAGHPIVYVTVTFAGGRTQQVTVPHDLARTVQRWIGNYGRWWQAIEDVSAINRRLLQLRQIPSDPLPRRARRARPGSAPTRARQRRDPQR